MAAAPLVCTVTQLLQRRGSLALKIRSIKDVFPCDMSLRLLAKQHGLKI
jgi:hypothetical protein